MSVLLFLIPLLLSLLVKTALHKYDDLDLDVDTVMYRRAGMFGPSDTPSHFGEDSFIKIDLKFERTIPESHGEKISMQLAIFDESAWENIGITIPDQNGK